ncbi:L-threonylcarbamoyladenylate synthase [Ferrimicrobium acidiphilum]|uniref:L-threonylcarbamoyladenylate synthase n=1 Tax=Ferrimicrobium acidiphilum TaxID=121039 RepID=UPI003C6D4583
MGHFLDGSDQSINLAVNMLRAGRVVALPTETVYGLAADASNRTAVARVFAVKGRPVDHPLIVHLGQGANLAQWAKHIPDQALRLAEVFWPGPLTMIFERHSSVPDEVTGGLNTVALRVPDHPVFQKLLRLFDGGVAAPSANRFGCVSPTTAVDVWSSLGAAVDLIVDGGPCEIGIESTIVAFEGDEAVILRPGGASSEAIANVLGYRPRDPTPSSVRAPGMLASHYAPVTALELCTDTELAGVALKLVANGMRVGILSLGRTVVPGAAMVWDAGCDIGVFARSLYGMMRRADADALDVLVVALPPDEGLGVAIRDRLYRAAYRPIL